MKKIFSLLLIAAVVLGMCSCKFFKYQQAQREREKQSDMRFVGGAENPVNTEYDVSQYRIPEDYELNSSNITISELGLKTYADSKLQEITDENELRIVGKYQDYNFLIIRRDCFDEWRKYDSLVGVYYDSTKGYVTASYSITVEFSKYADYSLEVFKDPSDRFIILTNCADYKIITEFFE